MSNKELLERCKVFIRDVKEPHYSTEQINKFNRDKFELVRDIESELSKPSQIDKSAGAIEILQLAHVEHAKEIEQLKSKLAKEQRENKAIRAILDTQSNELEKADIKLAEAEKDEPIRHLLNIHAELLENNPYCYFELAYTRQTDFMAWLCSKPSEDDPNRKVIANGQGVTPEEACSNAIQSFNNTKEPG